MGDGCYSKHNEALRYLARDPEASSINENFLSNLSWDDFSFGNDFSFESDDEAASDDTDSWGDDSWGGDSWGSNSWGGDDGDDRSADVEEEADSGWGSSWDSFWRKRRDVDRVEIIDALTNILNSIEHPKARANVFAQADRALRKRRQAILGQSADEFEERQEMIDQIKVRWVQNDFGEAGAEAEEEEAEENAFTQILERREFNDQAGMEEYLAKLTEEASIISPCEYQAMPHAEAHMAMTLHYVCKLDCGLGKAATAYNSATGEVHDIDDYKMECKRHWKAKPKESSECTSMIYPNLRVNCDDVEEEESFEESVEEVEELIESFESVESSEYNLDDYYAMGDFMIGK